MNLFKKVATLTDLHLGLKSNSFVHNEDCIQFVQWFIKTAKDENCDTVIIMGDWHNSRAHLNVVTLNYSIKCLELLSKAFPRVLFIPGNHDLYYRDKRDIQSIEWAKYIPSIEIINDFYLEGDVSIVPWLMGDEYKKIPKIKAKYMFGHFELPHFLMNAKIAMPEHGQIKREDFVEIEHVYSGHFHMRQTHKNITYTGNCFPHNYADAWDDERGMMVLEWGGEPKFISWPDQPRYRTYKLSELLDRADTELKPKMHLRVNLDIDITYEESNYIKETFTKTYKLREITLLPMKNNELDNLTGDSSIKFESVDQIVTRELSVIDTEFYDPKILLEIYRTL